MFLPFRWTESIVREFFALRNSRQARDQAMAHRGIVEPLDRRVMLSFTPASTSVTFAEAPFISRVADFNRDGKPDLATILSSSSSVAILLGDGAGGFTQPAGSPIATNPQAFTRNVWVADMNRDAKPDLITLQPTGVDIHLGNGDGTFMAHQSVAVGGAAIDVEVVDLNRDALPDLLVQVADDNNLRVVLGQSGGGFASQTSTGLGVSTRVLEVADFNRDGKSDLFAIGSGPNEVRVFMGDGSGAFTLVAGSPIAIGPNPVDGRAGDFNRDGKLDILVVREEGVDVLPGNGDGTFGTAISGPITVQGGVVSFGDVNGDAAIDIIATEFTQTVPNEVSLDNPVVRVYLGLGDGRFALGPTVSDSRGFVIATADFNVDGRADLLALDFPNKRLTVLLNDQAQRGIGRLVSSAGPSYLVGDDPQSAAIVDFNNDGMADILVANRGSDNVSVLLGNSDGGYTTVSSIAAGDEPQGITVGDINLDGFVDIAVANIGSATLRILLGDGNGASMTTLTITDVALSSFELADVNRDGKLDLLMSDGFASVIHVRLGQGDGTFTAAAASPISLQTNSRANSITVADFNNDGKPDLIYTDNQQTTTSANGVSVNVYLGDGTGSFTSTASYSVPTLPGKTVVADLSGDGKPDIITPTRFDTLSVRLGTGDGTFGAEAILDTGGWPVDVAVADVNRDGKPDVLSVNRFGGDVSVFLGTGTGTFTSAQPITVGSGPADLSLADLNGDGRLDMVVVNSDTDSISQYYGNGTGGFVPVGFSNVNFNEFPDRMAAADINGDGKLDFVASVAGVGFVAGTVRPYLGDGSGWFTAGTPVTVGIGPLGLDIADLNGDGKLDIAVPSHDEDTVTVLLGDGAGGFSTLGSPIDVGSAPSTVKIADINGDGMPDLTVANVDSGSFTVLLNDGSAGFTASVGSPFQLDSFVNDLAVADLNRDGKPDVVAINGNTLNVRFGNGSGGFTTPSGSPLTPGQTPLRLTVADVNLDAKPDILTTDYNSDAISVFLGNGDGTFAAPTAVSVAAPWSVNVADFDGDGRPDLFVTIDAGTSTQVFRGDGTGAFSAGPGSIFTVGLAPQSAVVGDFNRDGLPDVLTSNVVGKSISVLMNRRASATRLELTAQANTRPGVAFPLTINAKFVNLRDSLYSGTVKLISSDPAANLTGGLPFTIGGNVPFSMLNDGTRTINITLHTLGSQTITAVDTVNGTVIGTTTVEVIPNRAPTAIISVPTTPTVAENEPAGTSATTFSTIDPDFSNTFTYTLVSGIGSADNALFTIDGNRLTSAAVFNFETKQTYSVRVRSTDQGGLFLEQNYTVNITNVNENPTNLQISSSAVAENVNPGTTIGTFTTTDPDANNTFTYALVAGTGSTDNASFSIVGNQLRTATDLNFENKSSYSIRVRSIDQGGLSFVTALTIAVSNVNEVPVSLNLAGDSVAENQPIGTVVGSFSTGDFDANDTFTYTLVSGQGDTDNALFSIVGNQLRTAASLNFESKSSFSIVARTTDSGGLTFTRILTITATDVNEAPTAIALTRDSTNQVQAPSTPLGTFSTTDPDTSNTFTYALVPGDGSPDNSLFTLDGNTLRTAAGFVPSKQTYAVRVRSTDASGLSTEQTFTLPFSTQFAISTVPVNGVGTLPLSPVTVRVTDLAGNLIGGDSSVITLAIASGPAGAVLGGNFVLPATSGQAVFSNLTLSLPGTYTFTATASGISPATSTPFSLISPDISLLSERGNSVETAPDLIVSAVRFRTIPTVSGQIVAGTVISGTLTLRNTGRQTLTGDTSVQFFFSSDAVPSTLDTSNLTLNATKLKLAANRTRTIPFNITVPLNLTGIQQLLAFVNPTGQLAERSSLNNSLKLRDLPVAAPVTNLTTTPATAKPTVRPGRRLSVTLPVQNTGNLAINSTVQLSAVFIDSLTGVSTTLGTFTQRARLRPGQSARLRLSIPFTRDLAGRTGNLVLTVDPTNTLNQSITTDNTTSIAISVSPT